MKKTRSIGAAAVVMVSVLALPSIAGADPGEWAVLTKIALWLAHIQSFVEKIKGKEEDISTHLNRIWPDNARKAIGTFIQPVQSIKSDLEKMSCAWHISPRLQLLDMSLFKGGSFCRNEYQMIFGRPIPGAEQDIDEYQDMASVEALRAAGEFAVKSEQWSEQANWLTAETLAGSADVEDPDDPNSRYSVGYSQRLAALAAAQLSNFLVEDGKLTEKELKREQLAIDRKWRDHRLQSTWAVTVYRAIGGETPPTFDDSPPMPMPSPEGNQ
jgi:hypothetical protein